jgi:hypothetical protein
MTTKRNHGPGEGLVEPEKARHVGPGEASFIDETDVEGHGWTNPAPPIDFKTRTPTSGGEFEPSDEPTGAAGPEGLVRS